MTMTKTDFHELRDSLKLNTQAFIDGSFCDAADGASWKRRIPRQEKQLRLLPIAAPRMWIVLLLPQDVFSTKAPGQGLRQNSARKFCSKLLI